MCALLPLESVNTKRQAGATSQARESKIAHILSNRHSTKFRMDKRETETAYPADGTTEFWEKSNTVF